MGYAELREAGGITLAGRVYPISLMAAGRVPVVVAPLSLGLDDPDPRFAVEGAGSRKKSAFQLAQEFLNASQECLWAVVTNGRQLRLLRDAATLTRPSFLEFDLEAILGEVIRYPDFAALWRILHASRAGREKTPGSDCVWEAWRDEGKTQGTRVREGLRLGVTQALIALGEGFLRHPANDRLRLSLHEGALTRDAFFQELLRLVYRLLFLFTLEERRDEQNGWPLLHSRESSQAARDIYAAGYSLRRLAGRALRRIGMDRHDDLWQGQRVVFLGLKTGEPRLALPALGGLFAAGQCPALDTCALDNRAFLAAIRHLRWARADGSLALVDYGNMGPEELGSVYESLLELVPTVDLPGRSFGFVGLTEEGSTSGHARKTTGSYYTPDSLVQELIKSALDPLIESRLAARPDKPGEALLAITVIDPACGSGHFLLAAAERLAERLAQLRAVDGAVKLEDYYYALREVISHCIYGVDKNPMALELARTALWLKGYEPGRPLSFLDHHLVCGDALFGVTDFKQLIAGIPDAAFKPLSGDDKAVCKELVQTNRASRKTLALRRKGQQSLFAPVDQENAWSQLAAVESMPDETVAEVEEKRNAYAAFLRQAGDSTMAHAADCFIAAFLTPKGAEADLSAVPTSGALLVELFGDGAPSSHQVCVHMAHEQCTANRILHWPLAFPQVFSKGGFDCVLANPPWERIKLQEEEFFATRHPAVATAKNKAERGQRIEWLAQGLLAKQLYPEFNPDSKECEAEQRLYDDFIRSRRTAEATSIFAHVKEDDGGRYPLTGVGDVNTYALFAETISQIVSPQGRAGFIVPSGLATDNTTKEFFGALIAKQALESFFEFENEGFFPGAGQGHMLRFALTTIVGAATRVRETRFLFQGKRLEELTSADRVFSLAPSEIFLVNPNTRTCPIFRSRRDAELTKAVYSRVPVLMRDAEGDAPGHNPWGISFMRMFDMANDSHLFRTKADLTGSGFALTGNYFAKGSERFVPLYEAKMIHQYNHRHGDFSDAAEGERAHVLPTIPEARLRDTNYRTLPFYWVPEAEVEQLLNDKGWNAKWLIGWRDVTDARASARTLIASVIPRAGVNDKFLLMLPVCSARHSAALLGNLCSLVCDYVARQKVGGLALKYFTMKQFPVLKPEDYSEAALNFIIPRVLELTYTACDLEPWARDLGHEGPPFEFDPQRRAVLRAELDAYYAQLYGLDLDDLRFILDPQSVKPGYPSETFSVLKRSELREFSEYRTQRLVLAAWEQLPAHTFTETAQPEYTENPQVFPWPGRERFIYTIIPHLVAARPGMDFEYYRDAALLFSQPEHARVFLSSQSLAAFKSLADSVRDACTFPSGQHVRPHQIRKRLVANGLLEIDPGTGHTRQGSTPLPAGLTSGLLHLLPYVLEAADGLRRFQADSVATRETKQRDAANLAVNFIQAAVA